MNLIELLKLDNERTKLRAEMKLQLEQQAQSTNSESKIIFPVNHIPKDNLQLRRGLPWLYNGFIVYLPNMVMLVDPGVDILYRLAISQLNIAEINTMFVSHAHLDHVSGANSVSDWLIRAQQNTEIIAPESVFAEKEISAYHAGSTAHYTGWKNSHFSTIFKKDTQLKLTHGDYLLEPIALDHGAECYGFKLHYNNKVLTYISDTGYAKKVRIESDVYEIGQPVPAGAVEILQKNDWIRAAIKNSDTLIINVESLFYRANSTTHLCVYDAIDLIKDNGISEVIIAHCNPVAELDLNWAKEIADFIQESTQVKTHYPTVDGLKLSI